MIFLLLNSEILLGENETPSKLYVNWDNQEVRYITTNLNNENLQFFKSKKNPEKLNKEERYRVLKYCLGNFNKDEIVNYNDLFLQKEFITESEPFDKYSLIDKWLNL